MTQDSVLHVIRPSRGRAVPEAVFEATRPAVWVSDALGSHRGQAQASQMCLAHLLRDAQYRADLNRRPDRIMAQSPPQGRDGERLRRRIRRCREHLLLFVTDRDVPPTNNVSERALQPSVIFRKVTNGFRSEWGAATYAAFRTVVSTAKLNGTTVLDPLRAALCTGRAAYPG